MFFLIVNEQNGKGLYSTCHPSNTLDYSRIIFSFYKSRSKEDIYDIGFHVKSGLIFATFLYHPFFGTKILHNSMNVEEDILFEMAEKFSDLIDDKICQKLLKNDQNAKTNEFIWKKLRKKLFPWDVSICLKGGMQSGKKTVLGWFLGMASLSSIYILIPYNKSFNGKQIMFKYFVETKYWDYDLEYLAKEDYFLLFVNSSPESDDFKRLVANKNQLLKSKKKIIILASHQDLPDAIKPEEIQEKMEIPTYGFSALAPDATEQLENIISKLINL